MPSSGPLPPSVEKAYYRKCIELRRRITEIEDHNESARLRIKRLNRAILKMRLERAFLLEQLQQRMNYNVDDSDRSTSPPPTPQDKPLRAKRSHRKTTPTNSQLEPGSVNANSPPPSSHTGTQPPQPLPPLAMSSAQSTPDPSRTAVFPGSPTSAVNGTGEGNTESLNNNSSTLDPPLPRPHFRSAERDTEDQTSRTAARENGTETGHAGDAAAGEGASEERTAETNGDRNVEGDTEMTDAPDATGDSADAAGFTAVNR